MLLGVASRELICAAIYYASYHTAAGVNKAAAFESIAL